MEQTDERWLRRAFELAEESVREGDYAFGWVLATPSGAILVEARQSVVRSGDWLAHAEMNVLHEAARRYSRADIASATLYSSTEPCPMCTGAIAWSVNRVAFGLSQAKMYDLFSSPEAPPRFAQPWNSRTLLEHLHPSMEVMGPVLEEDAARAHAMWLERWTHEEP